MSKIVKIAAVQTNPRLGENEYNLDRILAESQAAVNSGADLIIFPECALTGYVFSNRDEAMQVAEEIPGHSTEIVADFCRKAGCHLIFGLLEKEGSCCYNTVVLSGPRGFIGKYRKIHLPYLGVDRFTDAGNEAFQVFETPVGNIGMLICYDCNFPESARVLTLLKADIIVLPTNWPTGRGKVVNFVVNTRAFENRVHLVAVDRVGIEKGTEFLGRSKIISATGDTLVEAGSKDEETIYAEVDLEIARNKHIVIRPGEFEIDIVGDRRPELYGEITKR